jgi:hypothetical protein
MCRHVLRVVSLVVSLVVTHDGVARQGGYSYLDPGAGAVEQEAALVGLDVVPAVARPAFGLLVDLETFRPELLAVHLGTAAAAAASVTAASVTAAVVVTRSVGVCRVARV